MTKDRIALLFNLTPELKQKATEAFNFLEMKFYEINSFEELDKKLAEGHVDLLLLTQSEDGSSEVTVTSQIRTGNYGKSRNNLLPILIIGENPREYYRIFQDQHYCRFAKNDLEIKEFTGLIKRYITKKDIDDGHPTRHLTKGEYLIREGSDSDEMYWVLSGKFNIIIKNSKGENVVIGEASPGELVGEMSFLDNMPRCATVKAVEESDVIIIPQDLFVENFDEQPFWLRSLMRVLSKRLRSATNLLTQLENDNDEKIELEQDDINMLIQKGLVEGF